MTAPQLSEAEIQGRIAQAAEFARAQNERFASRAQPLLESQKSLVRGFFEEQLLQEARLIVLENETVMNPEFLTELRTQGYQFLFDMSHLNALPFGDVVVYHETINKRLLFHGLARKSHKE